jgi:hypothetical protein
MMAEQRTEDERQMSMRRTLKGRSGLPAAAVTTALVLAVAGCSSDGGGGSGGDDGKKPAASSGGDSGSSGGDSAGDAPADEGDGGPLAEVKGSNDIALTISTAKRENGGFITLTGKVTNSGSKAWSGVEWKSDESEVGNANPASMAAARLVDKKGKKRYYILRDTEGRCLCTSFKGGLMPGNSKTWYAQFPAPPEGNDSVDFQIADLPTANITVSGE